MHSTLKIISDRIALYNLNLSVSTINLTDMHCVSFFYIDFQHKLMEDNQWQ